MLSHKYTKIRINSVNSSPLEKAINMENVIVAIKSLLNKKHNHYYYERLFRKKNSFKYKMLYHDRIDVSEVIDINSVSEECII